MAEQGEAAASATVATTAATAANMDPMHVGDAEVPATNDENIPDDAAKDSDGAADMESASAALTVAVPDATDAPAPSLAKPEDDEDRIVPSGTTGDASMLGVEGPPNRDRDHATAVMENDTDVESNDEDNGGDEKLPPEESDEAAEKRALAELADTLELAGSSDDEEPKVVARGEATSTESGMAGRQDSEKKKVAAAARDDEKESDEDGDAEGS
eukprot:6189711-Pleurochrysis_carterae.AAC.1